MSARNRRAQTASVGRGRSTIGFRIDYSGTVRRPACIERGMTWYACSRSRTIEWSNDCRQRTWEALTAGIGHASTELPGRVAIVVAHPDDEIVSAGALLRRLSLNSRQIHVIHVTDGAPLNGVDARAHGFRCVASYRRERRRELSRALTKAEIECAHPVTIGIADQRAAYSLLPLTQTIAEYLRSRPVDVVLTHPFEGGHPDHDACAFAVHAAITLLRNDLRPLIAEFTSYHAGGDGIRTGAFLNNSPSQDAVLALRVSEQLIKRRARDCFVSQAAVLAPFPIAYERFRMAPPYAFACAPHQGRLFYEHFEWGLDAARWQSLAAGALRSLGFGAAACL